MQINITIDNVRYTDSDTLCKFLSLRPFDLQRYMLTDSLDNIVKKALLNISTHDTKYYKHVAGVYVCKTCNATTINAENYKHAKRAKRCIRCYPSVRCDLSDLTATQRKQWHTIRDYRHAHNLPPLTPDIFKSQPSEPCYFSHKKTRWIKRTYKGRKPKAAPDCFGLQKFVSCEIKCRFRTFCKKRS